VIDVGMAQDHGIDRLGRERKSLAIAFRRVAATLDHAAVEQQFAPADAQYVAGAGHLAGGTEKFEFHRCRVPREVP
jgi:hypothetical protein